MEILNKNTNGITFFFLLLIGFAINASGLLIPILDSDGTLYATIAKTIAQTNDFVNLKVSGKDWLDKPHFPFWMAALSYKLFGYTGFAYKLPAFCFWLLGAFYTWLFAKKNYGNTQASLAALIYLSATHLILSNNDVRAEPYLTGMIIGATYHFYKVNTQKYTWVDVLLGCLLTAFAIMTKGIFLLITIFSGFVLQWLLKKDWHQFIRPVWWLSLLLICVFSMPEIYCLYVQFDIHPEKVVFDKTGVSGIRFFFWDSQFGRFFNNGPIKGDGDYFFFVHTLLWAFLPWCFILYHAIGNSFKQLVTSIKRQQWPVEYVTFLSGIFSVLIFSLSKFQLPHYTNILFPFFCIISAHLLVNISAKQSQIHLILLRITAVLMWLIVLLLTIFYQPDKFAITIGLLTVMALLVLGVCFKIKQLSAAFSVMYGLILLVFCFLNLVFYPALLQYQAGSNAAHFANRQYPGKKVYAINRVAYSLTFYTEAPCFDLSDKSIDSLLKKEKPILIYGDDACVKLLQERGKQLKVVQSFPYFHVAQLNGQFINAATREKAIQHFNVALVQ